MIKTQIWVLFISFCLLLHTGSAVEEDDRNTLINFLAKLNGTEKPDPSFGWINTTDPCQGWKGVVCDSTNTFVRQLLLNRSSLSGAFDAASLCNLQSVAMSLTVIRLDGNSIRGQIPAEISSCKSLTRLLIGHNQFSGNLPDSLAGLNNLKRLDISYNAFSGSLPDLARISGLQRFLAQYNQLTGQIPSFDFSNFDQFNVSYNSFSGPIPDLQGKFDETCFLSNPGLCGPPLPKACPLSPPPVNRPADGGNGKKPKGMSKDQVLMLAGFVLLAFVLITLFTWKLCKAKKIEEEYESSNKVASISTLKPSGESSGSKTATSTDSALVSSSMVVLTSPIVNGLKFEDLLRAPAELLGRGKHGSLYKVHFENRMTLVVKRIKDWHIPVDEFKQRMERIYQASHPNVLPPLAFYCSLQEKLLVYEYQQKGSLFKFLQGNHQGFDWPSRLAVAAGIAEALAFMHQELSKDGVAHGNLKSSNIIFNSEMEACISEYGLLVDENRDVSSSVSSDVFKADICGFGVILLELLTGKPVQSNGNDLAKWVHSVVSEEWTAEVFDKSLISEGASEPRMVNLLQVAIKCVNPDPEARPTISQVARMIKTIKEEEERSVGFSS
ncbi:hypothetical protein Tsubulata_049902 [Turnera subulata]|uniref:Protein kinase domain-containing protein n=1 Tax=Turnera subulata TaxID=218843 RepID=A0A9Q0FMT5_9ROSI|nr:hypothetical protein Tsubulata_049902 [Turnera subulata]